ncbi:metallophosphoesterase [Sphingomonas sp. UYP23]
MPLRPSKLLMMALIPAVALLSVGWVGFSNATAIPIERTTTVALDGLPDGTPPIRVALLSDIHVGNVGMRPARLAQIVRAVNAARPDLVVLAGDFVIGEQKAGAATRALELAPLAGLRATGGVYAVLGNHDHWTDPEAIRQNLARAGVRVLENATIRSGPLALVGIGDRFSSHDDIARSVARADAVGGVPLAFTHSPDIAPDLPKRFQVLLAGHTHCGQVVLPWIGPLVRTSHGHRLYDPRYRCGRIDSAGRSVLVTAGVGSGTLPLRIGAMPDWWLIVLKPRNA